MAWSGRIQTIRVIRRIARALSGLAVGFILIFFLGHVIGEEIGPFYSLSVRETLMTIAFAAMTSGLVLSWKWEVSGGLLTILGLVAFYLVDFLFSGTFPAGPFFIILASPGLLFLYCGLSAR